MLLNNIALYNWNNGVIMIGIFALVCLILVAVLLKFMFVNGKKKDEN